MSETSAKLQDLPLLTDDELITLIRDAGSSSVLVDRAVNQLLERYRPLILRKSQACFLIGAERQDLMQVGNIALYKAILHFRSSEGSFSAFAARCIGTELISTLRSTNRRKHKPLNEAVSLNQQITNEDEESAEMGELLEDPGSKSPEDMYIETVSAEALLESIRSTLSTLEKRVLDMFLSGSDYKEIAAGLDIPVKSADNAIQRIRKKAKRIYEEQEGARS
ncbi:MAG: sigma-70 family RNA polymerase sigma factor [Lachnospiraceae bacterium]|nr:sigma-70 family RNA polymerase sigma factor [Lachnospiraceae bacterium]